MTAFPRSEVDRRYHATGCGRYSHLSECGGGALTGL
jgi:hypothetical protein